MIAGHAGHAGHTGHTAARHSEKAPQRHKKTEGASKMDQQAEGLATKPDGLSSIPQINIVEEESW